MRFVVEREIASETNESEISELQKDMVAVEARDPHEAIAMSQFYYKRFGGLVDVVGVYEVGSYNHVESILREAGQ